MSQLPSGPLKQQLDDGHQDRVQETGSTGKASGEQAEPGRAPRNPSKSQEEVRGGDGKVRA